MIVDNLGYQIPLFLEHGGCPICLGGDLDMAGLHVYNV